VAFHDIRVGFDQDAGGVLPLSCRSGHLTPLFLINGSDMTALDPGQSAARGILLAMFASLCFATNDMLIKLMSSGYPLHELVFFRSAFGLILTMVLIMPLEGGYGNIRTKRPWAHVFRGLCVVVANSTYFAGIVVMPLADASAIFFVAPLMITGLSVVLLREQVGMRRWLAVLAGLLGVVIVVRPGGAGFSPVVLLPLIAAAAYASLQIMTRAMGLSEKASTMAMYLQLVFLGVSMVVGLIAGDGHLDTGGDGALHFLLRAWGWPMGRDWLFLVATGFCTGLGGYAMTLAYRGTAAGLVAPFEYVALPLAVFWGALIWSETPDMQTWIGIALIMGAGIFVSLREATLGRKPSAKRVSARR